ncbi:MAG: lasso peptide biosynthesis B2 protein [Bradyrhizobium sp.]|uniref:lasso peptide biosynthesis B2 protein n=1 Tax=Bradyrhizobium sp. TaxID=376 RepID=UPI002726D9D5|nr:lasso peptide biosynthesis B2 protein [Bradyrhizobium sp.]MDO9563417.1 lasso peptide biosynthesis B2 protein [Bradyrhizobium sp.]MDP3691850.1 lasso peptide biosynthesis B2 protein [Bradyrhizobium sp.]
MSVSILCFSHFSTKLFGIDRTVTFFRWLGRARGRGRSPDASAEDLAGSAIRGMQLLPLRIECLDQAVATWYVLNRHGHPASLRIGMRLSPLSGHAWVICNEQTFIETPGMEDFTVVASYPPWLEATNTNFS